MITLEPDQRKLVDGVRASMQRGNRWVLMQSPTGSGKTYMGSEIIHGTLNKGTRCMLVVPRKELLKQSAAALREFDIPFSYVADGYDTNPFAQTFLAMSQTLGKRVKNGTAPDVNLILQDETHYGGHALDEIIQHYKAKGARGIGMSATPWFLNGSGLDCWYDDMVQGEDIATLIRMGRLSDYRPFGAPPLDLSQLRTSSTTGDYSKEQLNAMMKADGKLVGCAVSHYRQHAMGKLAIAYCTSVEHAELTALRFNEAGIPAASIDGKKTDDERTKIIKAFARREILVLANCELLTFGFDLSSASGMDVTIEAMIDLRPTKSLALQMQKWGRALRRKPFPAIILDHAGNFNEHGYPDDPREWSLQGTRSKNLKFKAAGVAVKNCSGGYANRDLTGEKMPACFYSHRPAPRCPGCGAWYDYGGTTMIQTLKGELTELSDRPARRAFTTEEADKLRETIDALTKNAAAKGMPAAAAQKWAIGKATSQLEAKIDRESEPLQVSLHMGNQELPL